MYETSANMGGSSGSINAFLVGDREKDWIVDSGATNYMVSDINMLDKKQEVNKNKTRKVHLPNGGVAKVTHIGSCRVGQAGTIDNVLYIPDFKYNLLSVAKITRALNCSVCFFPDFFMFQDLYNGDVKAIGREDDGLYLLSQRRKNEE